MKELVRVLIGRRVGGTGLTLALPRLNLYPKGETVGHALLALAWRLPRCLKSWQGFGDEESGFDFRFLHRVVCV